MHEVTVEELQSFAAAVGLGRIAAGRCATLFLFQLYTCTCLTNVLGDAPKVVAEIAHLEGLGASRTKPHEAFQRPPLLGLKKKHYVVGGVASVARNILLAAGRKQREFRQIAERRHNPATASLPASVIAKDIADEVTKLYADRSEAQRLTGNWIVFAEHDGKNFYLCLASHDEGDDTIAGRIKNGCYEEFPFLRDLMA
jgi:hypothetical protein